MNTTAWPREVAALGLVIGALLGATAVNVLYRLPHLIASRLSAQPDGLSTAASLRVGCYSVSLIEPVLPGR
jgi:hypothetical protein